MSRRSRDLVGELLRLVDLAGDDENNLGEFLFAHEEALAAGLEIPRLQFEGLAALDDGELKRRLAPGLERARQHRREQRAAIMVAAAEQAVEALVASAQWRGEEALLNPVALLSPGITNASVAFVMFVAEDFAVGIDRTTFVKLRRDLPRFADLVAVVGAEGLRLEWRAGRGRLQFFFREVPKAATRLVVRLRARERVSRTSRVVRPTVATRRDTNVGGRESHSEMVVLHVPERLFDRESTGVELDYARRTKRGEARGFSSSSGLTTAAMRSRSHGNRSRRMAPAVVLFEGLLSATRCSSS